MALCTIFYLSMGKVKAINCVSNNVRGLKKVSITLRKPNVDIGIGNRNGIWNTR